MKYGETIFDIAYLLITFIIGIIILKNSKNKNDKLMGYATLVLVFGDSFHLIPRFLSYFINADFTKMIGLGKLVTSITITIFYIFMYYIYERIYKVKNKKTFEYTIWILFIIRIILCLLPQNRWITNDGSVLIGIIRNIPFVIMGSMIIKLYYNRRKEDIYFKNIWLYITLSFIFYMIVVLFSSYVKMLGMFMLPKTICYVLIVIAFKNKVKNI